MGRNLITSLALLVSAIAIAAALGGCGGGSSGNDSGGSGEISKEEFTEQADAICNRGKKQGLVAMTAYLKQHEGSGKAKSELLIEAIHATFLPDLQKQVDQIRALGAPAGEEEQVKAFLAAMEEGVETAGKANANAQFGQSFKHSAELARELGIDACAYG